jgi:hypothetical protein
MANHRREIARLKRPPLSVASRTPMVWRRGNPLDCEAFVARGRPRFASCVPYTYLL